jgi:tetratricopeptide (TPR) repeat protein
LFRVRRDTPSAIRYYKRALHIDECTGDRYAQVTHLLALAEPYIAGDPGQARDLCARAMEVVGPTGNRRLEAAVRLGLGRACLALGEATEARAHLEEALDLASRSGDRCTLGRAYAARADACRALGDVSRAIEEASQALALAREVRDRWGEGVAHLSLGESHRVRGDQSEAIGFYERAVPFLAATGHPRATAVQRLLRQLLCGAPHADAWRGAFAAFVGACSLEEMRDAVAAYPFLAGTAFLEHLCTFVRSVLDPDPRARLVVRLRWIETLARDPSPA